MMRIEMQTFFAPEHIFQTIAVALSIFNLVTFLWLALTVWLNGDRRSWVARMGVVGLALSALFFYIHALLIFAPLGERRELFTPDFLWHLIWLPALGVPYIWFAIGLHYAALINEGWRRRRPMLLVSSGILGCMVFLLLIANQSTFTFSGTLRLLAYSSIAGNIQSGLLSPVVWLPILFLCYVTFCAIAPWLTLGRISRLWSTLFRVRGFFPLVQALADAFWDDPTDVEQLDEPALSWHLARPGLFLAALFMVGLTTTLAVISISSLAGMFLHRQPTTPVPQTLTTIPLDLMVLDMLSVGAVALIILMVGYSVVRHGILIERPLARRGFFEQWRGIVIVATTVAILIVLLVTLTNSKLGGLLLITTLATAAYALFTWSSYTARDRYIAMLGQFLRNTNSHHWLNTDLQKTEQDLESLFFHLCHEVLAVQCARLTILSGPVRRTFNYRWPASATDETMVEMSHSGSLCSVRVEHIGTRMAQRSVLKTSQEGIVDGKKNAPYPTPRRMRITLNGKRMICWILPIHDELGLVAMLYLGPREDGAVFTDEDMNLAHACGQRILDTLGDHEAMQAVSALLKRRIVDVKLLGAQQRRLLHDEILPQMHLALLRLETLRSLIPVEQTVPARAQQDGDDHNTPLVQAVDETVEMITDAHRRLAAMMRATATGAPHRLERDGMMRAIHTMLDQDFQQAFDEVNWCVTEETERVIDEKTPPAIAELIFAAVQEALRNAARHARGSDIHRRLRITLKASCDPHLEVIVSDDGVGILSASSSTTGTGGGLLTHSALLAIAGGSLTVKSNPGEGVSVRIVLPAEALL
jgi:two-component sensor histidine kinase